MRWRGLAPGLAALGLAAACGGPGGIEVRDAHVVPAPAGRGPAGGFAVLHNGGASERALLGATSPACARVELHRSWLEGDVARMAPVARAAIPPGEELRLEPGGHHLMLFDCALEAPRVALRLELDGGETLDVDAEVRAGAGHGAHEHEP